jgi:acyl-CoA reductase-like NAD-dependent aldehyde dehydrogenase
MTKTDQKIKEYTEQLQEELLDLQEALESSKEYQKQWSPGSLKHQELEKVLTRLRVAIMRRENELQQIEKGEFSLNQ